MKKLPENNSIANLVTNQLSLSDSIVKTISYEQATETETTFSLGGSGVKVTHRKFNSAKITAQK